MRIDFNASPRPTLGVEIELSLVDNETRALTSVATDVLAALAHGPDGQHPKAKHELFQCTVEVITGVCDTVDEALDDLTSTLAELRAEVDARGVGLCCAGTHPFSRYEDQSVSPDPRYLELVESIQWPARQLAIYGVHFHVGVPGGEAAVQIVNSLAYALPLFLALSASSPYWLGEDTGMASSRTKVFEVLPTAGLPPELESWDDFERFMGTLMRAEAITSIRDVWWDVRPHPDFGTVELRMCDGIPTLAELGAVAALAQSLVARLTERFEADDPLPTARPWTIKQNKWLACRHGLDAMLLAEGGLRRPAREWIEETVDDLAVTARRLGCADELADVRRIVAGGASYARQRAVVDEGGTLEDVVDHLVGELAAGTPATW